MVTEPDEITRLVNLILLRLHSGGSTAEDALLAGFSADPGTANATLGNERVALGD